MRWIVDPFAAEFMQRALLAGLLVAVICAFVGTWVVLRGLAFVGDALAHGVLPGIAVATLMEVNPMIGAVGGALLMIGGVTLVTRRSRLSSDTAIGLLFVGMLALGVVIVSRSRSFQGDLVTILFGEILAVGTGGLIVLGVAAAAVAFLTWLLHRPFLLMSFDPEQARASGFSPRLFGDLLMVLVALTVVVSFQTVGTLLVMAMLLAPAGTGALLARRLPGMIAVAVACGSASVVGGLLASWYLNLAASASIALFGVVLFFAALSAANLLRRHRAGSA